MESNITIDLEQNFWNLNPFFKLPFKDFYDADKSKNKKESSDLMWVFTLLNHHHSPIYELSYDLKLREINTWFLKEPIEDLSEVKEWEDKFKEYVIPAKVRFLNNWRIKLEERDAFIASLPYNADNIDMLEKLLTGTKKIWDQYLAAVKEAEKDFGSATQGDIQESATELGLI